MQKIARLGPPDFTAIRRAFLAFGVFLIQTVISVIDHGADSSSHTDSLPSPEPEPDLELSSDLEAGSRGASGITGTDGAESSVNTSFESVSGSGIGGGQDTPPNVTIQRFVDTVPVTNRESAPGPQHGPPPGSLGPPPRGPPPGGLPHGSPPPRTLVTTVATQTDVSGSIAYTAYMDRAPAGTLASHPDMQPFLSEMRALSEPEFADLSSKLTLEVNNVANHFEKQVLKQSSSKILRTAVKLDERLEKYLEELETKANLSITAVDIEAEERRQRQEQAQK